MSSATGELPRISIKTNVQKQVARPFVAKVVSDSLQPARFNVEKKPYQWTIAVEPIKNGDKGFQIGGKTGAFWEYVGVPIEVLNGEKPKEQDKFGRHFLAFQNVFGTDDDEDRTIGRGEFLNEVGWFIKDTVIYGTNKTDGSEIKGTVLLPQRRLTAEEMVEYGLSAAGSAPTPAVQLSDDELEALARALDGKDRNALQKAVYTAKLGNKIAQAVGKGNGPAVQQLLDSGRGSFDGDTFRAS